MTRRTRIVIASVAGAVVLAAVAAAIALHLSLDGIVQRAIERHGTRVLGTRVTVGSVDLSPRSGAGVIRNVRIANPEGFSRRTALAFAEIRFQVELATLRQDPVVVSSIEINSPEVLYELNAARKANLDVLKASVGSPPKPPAGSPPPRKLRMKSFAALGGRITADTSAAGGPTEKIDLEPVRLKDVGGSGGAPADQVGARIVLALEREVTRAVAREGLRRAIDKKVGGDVKERLKSFLK